MDLVLSIWTLEIQTQIREVFNGADDIADWFRNDNRSDDWRQRD